MPDDPPEPYRLSDDLPPRRKYRPMPGVRASSERDPDEFDKPVLRRFFGADPFPWVLAVSVLLWVGLGLGTRVWVGCAGLLVVAGLTTVVLSQLWLAVSIYQDDRASGILSLISSWYQAVYLHMYPEVGWRPSLLAGVGLLMVLTGFGLGVTHLSR